MSKSSRLWLIAAGLMLAAGLACSLSTGVTPTPDATANPQPVQTLPPVAMVTSSASTPTVATATATIGPTPTPTGEGPGGCILKSTFIADVTIPDNTMLAAGTAFAKTWRVRNDGTCTWENYQLVFADGNQFSGPGAANVGLTPPGSTTDISINLTAPAAPGNYTGRWRLRATNGVIFGGLTVVIVVPATPTPTATSTPTPAPTTSASAWSGKWISNCGAPNCGNVLLTQTGNTVTGTFATDGVINGTVIDNRLTGTWLRGGLAGSIDWWLGGTGVKWRGNYNGTESWCGHREGETDPAPCGVGTFAGDWFVLCTGCDGPMKIAQDGRLLTGTFVNGTLNGTIDGITATGTWRKNDGSTGSFTWYLLNGVQFNGNGGGSNQWCGYRSGSGAPTPCLK